MTDRPDEAAHDGHLDQHLDALGRGLAEVERRAEGQRRLVRRGATSGAVALAVGLGALVGLPGGQRLDPVDRARAALADSGGLLHWTVQTKFIDPDMRASDAADWSDVDTSEAWARLGGAGEVRVRRPADGRPRTCAISQFTEPTVGRRPRRNIVVVTALVEPTEFASSANHDEIYSPWSRTLLVTPRPPRPTPPAEGPGTELLWGSAGSDPRDPIRAIRAALDQGQLRDDGTVERDGRTLRRLVGEGPPARDTTTTPSAVDPRTGRRVRVPGPRRTLKLQPSRLTYLLDPESFVPVEISIRRNVVWSRAGGYAHVEWITQIARFSTFERLLDTPQNRRLLRVDAPADTTIVRRSSDPQARRPKDQLTPRLRVDPAAQRRCEAARRSQSSP